MKLLPRQLRKETFIYFINLPATEFKKQLAELFNKGLSGLLDINLTGEFKSDNSFSVTKGFSLSFSSGGGQSFTSLIGEIKEDQQKTKLTLIIKPNPTVYVFAIAFPLVSYSFTLLSIINHQIDVDALIVIFIFGIVFPLAACLWGQYAKDDLRNKFVKYFNLNETL